MLIIQQQIAAPVFGLAGLHLGVPLGADPRDNVRFRKEGVWRKGKRFLGVERFHGARVDFRLHSMPNIKMQICTIGLEISQVERNMNTKMHLRIARDPYY